MLDLEGSRVPLDQIKTARDGRRVLVSGDVLNVVAKLEELDPRLCVSANIDADPPFYVVYRRILRERGGVRLIQRLKNRLFNDEDFEEEVVSTTPVLDDRLFNRIAKMYEPGFDIVANLHKIEAEEEREREREMNEKIGAAGERLAHALRKDLDIKNHIIVPEGVESALATKPAADDSLELAEGAVKAFMDS